VSSIHRDMFMVQLELFHSQLSGPQSGHLFLIVSRPAGEHYHKPVECALHTVWEGETDSQ
jgi:hypothetical protein